MAARNHVETVMSKITALLALLACLIVQGCGAIEGNTSRSTSKEQIRYLMIRANALEREADEFGRLKEEQEKSIAQYAKEVQACKQEAKKLRHAKDEEGKARYDAVGSQIGYYERQAHGAKRVIKELKFEANKLRVEARRLRREAWRIEKFTSEPIYDEDHEPRH